MLLGIMLLSAIAEVLSLGAVVPFLAVLASPEEALAHPSMRRFVGFLSTKEPEQLRVILTLGFIAAVAIAAAIRAWLLWATTRYTLDAGVHLSTDTFEKTIYQNYEVHVKRNSSTVITGLTMKINSVVFAVMMQILVLMSSVLVSLLIVITLLLIQPGVALSAGLGLMGGYLAITWMTRRKLRANSEIISLNQTELVNRVQDGLGGIRDAILDGSQPVYVKAYEAVDVPLRQAQCTNTFIAQSPKLVMESFGMIVIAGLALWMSQRVGGISAAIPVLGAFALGAQRLLPSLQQVYSAWQSVAGHHAVLDDVLVLLDQRYPSWLNDSPPEPLKWSRDIELRRVSFAYAGSSPVIENLNLKIEKGARIGFVGSTGSGKSTLLDIIVGLLEPTSGQVLVDGNSLDSESTLLAWQRAIAHVPQNIYLSDATIARNVAFGVPDENIDYALVERSVQQAGLSGFVDQLPHGLETIVGERGGWLSGGQRQRVGIARALYKRASLLVLDEATSALDNATERAVMGTIGELDRDLTILMIAHRLSTVRQCDWIFELDGGRIVSQGIFEQLLESSPTFRNMAEHPGS